MLEKRSAGVIQYETSCRVHKSILLTMGRPQLLSEGVKFTSQMPAVEATSFTLSLSSCKGMELVLILGRAADWTHRGCLRTIHDDELDSGRRKRASCATATY